MEKGDRDDVQQEGPAESEREVVQDDGETSYVIWNGGSGYDQEAGKADGSG